MINGSRHYAVSKYSCFYAAHTDLSLKIKKTNLNQFKRNQHKFALKSNK